MVVRDATPDDARSIARVRGESWRAAYEHIFGPERLATISADADAGRWDRWLSDLPVRAGALVAVSDRDVVGFASHGPSRDDPDLGELFTIYVLPDAWGAGVGRALMGETLARLRTHGFGEAILWVLEDNPRTRRFYELAGWQTDGEVKVEEWLGIVVREVRYRIDLR
jgi:GNAT superfamily N-acetyltransferase